jgi:hypothetical protein
MIRNDYGKTMSIHGDNKTIMTEISQCIIAAMDAASNKSEAAVRDMEIDYLTAIIVGGSGSDLRTIKYAKREEIGEAYIQMIDQVVKSIELIRSWLIEGGKEEAE